MARKGPRVIVCQGDNKTRTIKEHPDPSSDIPRPGYAVGFEALLAWVNDHLLMPISSRRQLLDLPDDMATKVKIVFYSDPADAFMRAILE